MKKIVVIGPESTGKSTLSAQLAAHYQTLWVPEFAREYLTQLNRPYEQEDLLRMAEGQLITEDEAAEKANKLLICDTDLHVIKVWSEAKYGDCDPRILELIATRKYDLYLLTYIDIAWEDDPLREHPKPEEREYFYQIYRDIVMNSGQPWADIRGGYEQRLQTAVGAVGSLFL
ncbi:AAA family ATPase [Chitinophaga niabensis]|uniref:Nicotinamide-nucleotide adenylyltransferase, NadR type n=1 Tax=Chitinophaga niabensis TaxID=536979 RepID=A0A1N6JMX7_9BACT|nr:ATP-binding protein [Chitinophaga niabensis]SIO45539.1 nicotinamide-nucleotide adenylyltransferase, NadR type [Chitinophaga niabensis]